MADDKTSQDRAELARKLDAELEEFIASRPKTEYKDGFSEDNWEQEIQLHPAFRTEPIREGEELPPLVEAMRQLKYDPDENTPKELAINYKEDGNYNFKLKQYRFAIAAYSEGLKQKCDDAEINAQLYTNRATAQFYLGNFRSSVSDCKEAIKCKKDHIKAFVRAVKCFERLNNSEEGLEWCKMGLKLDPRNEVFIATKAVLEKQKKLMERDKRKTKLKENINKLEMNKIQQEIKNRHIKMSSFGTNSQASEVHLNDKGQLIWPVLFLYPEYRQSDIIQQFNEDDSFELHLGVIFEETPLWDIDGKYTADQVKLFFEDRTKNILWEINPKRTLKEVLQHESYTVSNGLPEFLIVAISSPFQQFFQNCNEIKAFS